jgi:Na+/proline symporter
VQATAGHIRREQLNFFGAPDEPLLATIEKWAIPITGSVIAQELISRILATRTPQTAQRAALLGGGIYFVVGMIPVFLGLIGVHLLPGLDEPEQLLPRLAAEHLPTLLYIIFAGALISAILSTVDSALLAASALVEHNLIVPLRPQLGDRARVRIARIGVALFGVVAYVLALQAESIYALVVQASALAGAGIFVVVMFGLFTRFGGPRAALAALITGLVTWFSGEYLFGWPVPYLSSLATALLAYVTVGAFEPAQEVET